jgi:hypothetical protein
MVAKIQAWIGSHPRERVIGACVLASHLFLIFFHASFSSSPPPNQHPILVHTYMQKAQPKQAVIKKPVPPLPKPKPKKGEESSTKHLASTKEPIEKSVPTSSALTPPKPIQNLSIDESNEEPSSYLSSLVQTLKNHLELPEEGKVRLQITVLKSGRVEKVSILYAESDYNKRYLEHRLIDLSLPPFSDELEGSLKHTFTLNFCHEK